jgi:ferredoxin
MAKLIFHHSNEEKELENESAIAQTCEEAGVPFACTEGICGTCIVEVVEGGENLSDPSQELMACQFKIRCVNVKITF